MAAGPELPDIARVFPETYEAQLQQKVERVQALFAGWTLPELQVFRSPTEHYRMRAEFGVWHDKGELYFIMHEQPAAQQTAAEPAGAEAGPEAAQSSEKAASTPAAGKKRRGKAAGQKRPHENTSSKRRRVDTFPRASRLLCELMAAVVAHVKGNDVLSQKLFQVNFHTTLSGDAMVTLLYHKKLDAAWTSAAQQLRAALARDCPSFRVPSSSPSQPAANGHAATAHAARPAPAAASQAASSEQPSGSSQPAANGHAAPAEPVPQAAAAASAAADGLADPSTAGSTSQGAALAAEAVTTDKPAADAASRDGVQQHPVPPDRVTDSTAAPEQPSPAAAVSRDAEAGGEQAELLDDAPLPGLLGRARKQRIVLGRDHVTELMPVGERTLTYRQLEGAFSQPNGAVCGHMLHWAVQATRGCSGDLLELYCGNGNFTVALAPNFGSVVATEVAKPSVAAALHNAEANGERNLHIARLSSEDFVQAWRGERTFTRLQGLDLQKFQLNTLFVDPPRAGLDPETEKLLAEFQHLVYVSCNPATLRANLASVQQTHEVKEFALFDQFPYTEHVECGVLLSRRPKSA